MMLDSPFSRDWIFIVDHGKTAKIQKEGNNIQIPFVQTIRCLKMAGQGTGEERTPLQQSGFPTSEASRPDYQDRLKKIRESITKRDTNGRLNVVVLWLLGATTILLCSISSYIGYFEVYEPIHKKKILEQRIQEHAVAARLRNEQCREYTWETACDALGNAGARRRLSFKKELRGEDDCLGSNDAFENGILDSDDPTIVYDKFCLRKYRLSLQGGITFPYHSGQLLTKGGNQTMALFIIHGALRNSEQYFCSFKKLTQLQSYRKLSDVLIISPDFNYEHDSFVHPHDAFWNSTKPWGDWRVGAESDPSCCGNAGNPRGVTPRTISSFTVLDNFLAMLTDRDLFPHMNKISFVGHSAGAQTVQRYALISPLAALWDLNPDVRISFIVANPSSYTYLTPERYQYACGDCQCDSKNCTCSEDCSPEPPYVRLGKPTRSSAGIHYPCYQWNYNRWPYGIGSLNDKKGREIPYALRDGNLGILRALRIYPKLHMVYMVGQNDTCNDGLPTCDASCWKRDNWEDGESKCFRNHMDTRCPAMLQGPCRNTRAKQYMAYLEQLYRGPTHILHEIEGVGHNASGMFSSEAGLKEIFGTHHDRYEPTDVGGSPWPAPEGGDL